MGRANRPGLVSLAVVGLLLAACGQPVAVAGEEAVTVEELEDSELGRITLSPKAEGRLGLETTPVTEAEVGGSSRLIVPYAAVIYDADGNAWAYVNTEPHVFIRHALVVETIESDRVVLSEGPPAGTPVVTVAGAELYGAETGVGGGH